MMPIWFLCALGGFVLGVACTVGFYVLGARFCQAVDARLEMVMPLHQAPKK